MAQQLSKWSGESGWFVIFRLFKSVLFFVNWISCTFSISYKMLRYYVYYYCILIRIWYAVETSFFFRALLASFCIHVSLLTICFFILFHFCCSHAQVFAKTFVHEFISYSHAEWYLLFFDSFFSNILFCIQREKVEILVH